MSIKKAYKQLKLVFPTEEYKLQMEEYLQEHFDNNEYDLAGDGGLDTIKDFDKWLYKVRNDVSEETIEKGQVTSTLFLAVRKSDDKVIGTLQIRHFLLKMVYRKFRTYRRWCKTFRKKERLCI